MRLTVAALLVVSFAAGCGAPSQTAAPQPSPPPLPPATNPPPPPAAPVASLGPLRAMPYTPSLDVASLDRSVDPCVDFYQFSCGGWMAHNPIPPDQAGWSVYAKLTQDNQRFLWGILDEDARAKDRTPVQQKVGDYFAACMDTKAIDAAGIAPIAAELEKVAAITSRHELVAEIARLSHEAHGTFFFDSGTEQDAADSSRIIVTVQAGGLGLPDRDYYVKADPKSVEIRDQYVAFVANLLVLGGDAKDRALAEAKAIVALETELAKASLTRVEQRDPHKIYHLMPLSALAALAPVGEWPQYFAAQGVPAVGKLNVSQPAFFKEVQTLLTSASLEDLRTYLRFHLLAGAAPHLAHPFEQASFDFYSHTLRGVPVLPPRWKTCARAVDRNLGEALGEEFVHRTFTPDTKARTLRMTEQIEKAMEREIKALDWMGPETKVAALRKLHVIRNKIGFPDAWRDYSTLTVVPGDYFADMRRAMIFEEERQWHKLGKPVDRNEWGMSPPTVNAYFDPQLNDINFPAGVLQPPLYDPKLDDAPNYGNTGGTIGHELTHAFDDEGRQFDWKGNLVDWWTKPDAKGFQDRLSCVQDQYKGFLIVDDIPINSKLTSGEDVADIGGTWLAYLAWKEQTAAQQLGDRDGFTPDQRFFVGMAQWACENQRPENLRVSAITNPHSPGFARVDGVVSNLPQFAQAFACKAGQPMVHAPVCKIW